ncbi:MAG: DUF3630 family protein [Anaerolineales bacterium]
MDVTYYEDAKSVNAGLAKAPDGFLFQRIADELSLVFNVNWKSKLDGLDQRYWDFEYKGLDLTLHLEHYLGIIIYADKSKKDIESVRQVLAEIADHFKTWKPSN